MFESLEVNAEHIPAYKLGFHLAQIVFAIVLWILEIVVFRAKDTPVTGSIGWTFAVVCSLGLFLFATYPLYERPDKLTQILYLSLL